MFFPSIRRLVMPQGSSSHRPEKRLKIAPEDDLESRVLSNWAPGNMVHLSNVEGLSAFPEEANFHPTPSYGLGISSSNPHPGILEPQPSVPGNLETDWRATESSIDHNKLLEYIQELEGLIGHQG